MIIWLVPYRMPNGSGVRSPNPEKINAIRSTKRVEPLNTLSNHPTNAYIPVGHGSETVGERHIVPKGCILVVKSHSGDTTMSGDFLNNIKAVLNIDNKEVIFDPVSHKKELYSLLSSDIQSMIKNISSSHSSAIYREGDTYNNFNYQTVNVYAGSIGTSGIFKIDVNNTITDFKKVDKEVQVKKDQMVFVKDASNNCIYSPDIIKLDIPSFFSGSNIYPYYYTKEHIEDILEFIRTYINLNKDGYMNPMDSEKKIVEILGKRYLNIKKGYTYVPDNFDHTPIYTVLIYGTKLECFKNVTTEEKNRFNALEIKNAKDDPRNKWIQCLRDMTLENLLYIIIDMTNTTQAELFKDVEDGIIKPGIFYNLICRATNNTLHTNAKNKNSRRMDGILNKSYIENSDHTIGIKNQKDEIKNRISEAVLQRKNQAKEVFNNKAKSILNYSSLQDDKSDIFLYIRMIDGGNYTEIYKLERIKKDIKLQAFNYIISRIEGLKEDLKDASLFPLSKKSYGNELLEKNKVLSNYYSKNALLADNKRVTGMLAKEKDPKEIEFLKSKIEFNNNFIKDHIEPSSWLSLKPTQFISTPEQKKEAPTILTNNYKKYRNETAKKYKKVNNKWVENVSTGGRRFTRKRKTLV